MSCRKILSSKKPKACIGGLSKRITISTREVVFRHDETQCSFTVVWTRWADVTTKSGLQKFNGININKVPSHIWIMRTISTLTSEHWINYNNNNYRILSVESVNEGDYQKVYCRLTGEDDLDGSESWLNQIQKIKE